MGKTSQRKETYYMLGFKDGKRGGVKRPLKGRFYRHYSVGYKDGEKYRFENTVKVSGHEEL